MSTQTEIQRMIFPEIIDYDNNLLFNFLPKQVDAAIEDAFMIFLLCYNGLTHLEPSAAVVKAVEDTIRDKQTYSVTCGSTHQTLESSGVSGIYPRYPVHRGRQYCSQIDRQSRQKPGCQSNWRLTSYEELGKNSPELYKRVKDVPKASKK